MENPVLDKVIVEDVFEAFCEACLVCENPCLDQDIALIVPIVKQWTWMSTNVACGFKNANVLRTREI